MRKISVKLGFLESNINDKGVNEKFGVKEKGFWVSDFELQLS